MNSYIFQQIVRQLAYPIFITNDRALFYLRGKQNLLKHQKVSKFYNRGFSLNFFLLFMFLLTAAIVKKSHI